jgi:hypothetical protein
MALSSIDRSPASCPNPVIAAGRDAGFLQFSKPADGTVHGLAVGDFVQFKSKVAGDDRYPKGILTHIEVVREDIGRGEETYARFYVTKLDPRTGLLRNDPCGGYGEVVGVRDIFEVVEDPSVALRAKASAVAEVSK